MNTPDHLNPPQEESELESDSNLFQEAIRRAFAPEASIQWPAGNFEQSYRFVTQSPLNYSSQDDSRASVTSHDQSFQKTGTSDGLANSNSASKDSRSITPPVELKVTTSTEGSSPRPSNVITSSRQFSTRKRSRKAAEEPPTLQPTNRELWGWWLCDVGMSGYKALLSVFFALLVFSLFAGSASFIGDGARSAIRCPYNVSDRDPRCLRVCDSFTKDLSDWTSGSASSNQRGSGYTILEILSSRSWAPALLLTVMLGLSVVLQLVMFVVASPLLDYGNSQHILLGVGVGIGVLAAFLPINLYRPEWWSLGAFFFLLARVGLGLASTWLDWCLSSLARGIPIVRTQLFHEVLIFRTMRTQFVNRISYAGVTFGCLSSTLCTFAAFFFLRYQLFDMGVNVVPNSWPLRIACSIGGVWLFCWMVFSYAFLLRDRPGPSLQLIPYPASKHLLMAVVGMKCGLEKGKRNALLLLVVCFLSSMGNATVFQSGLLCFSPRNFIKLALLAQFFSLAGSVLFFAIQSALSRSNQWMLLLTLLIHLLVTLSFTLGVLVSTPRKNGEFLVFAGAYGLCLGALRSHIRTLFLSCLPSPTLAGAYFSLLSLVMQLSTFVGTLETFLFVYFNGDLRYAFLTMGIAVLLACILALRYTLTHSPEDSDRLTDTDDSLYPASMASGSVMMSSNSGTSESSVTMPRSLRKQYTVFKREESGRQR